MPLRSRQTGSLQDIRVYIRDRGGRYLSRGSTDWVFTEDRSRAAVFYYLSDRVAEQIEMIRKTQGSVLGEEPVPLDEIYEVCDRCKELVVPFLIHFDGTRFLCSDCRSRVRSRPRPAVQ
jgi:hypothetical protein